MNDAKTVRDQWCDEYTKMRDENKAMREEGAAAIETLRKQLAEAWEARDDYMRTNSDLRGLIVTLRKRVEGLDEAFRGEVAINSRLTARAEQAEAQLHDKTEAFVLVSGHRDSLEAQLAVAREAATAALKDLEYFSRRESTGGDPSRFASIHKLRAALQQILSASDAAANSGEPENCDPTFR